jgi:hypothetical protein
MNWNFMEVFEVKKKLIITLSFLLIFIFSVVVVFKLWEAGAFIFNRSADVSSNHVNWNGKEYSITSGEYTEGRTITKGKSGVWTINMVKEDPSHTFIVARSFLDQYLMVSDDYTIPTSGKITTISWNGTYITDEAVLDAIANIEAEKVTTFTYETDGIYQLTDNQHMRRLYFAYENCPVATEFKGYMGKVNGAWVITTYISSDTSNADGSPKPYSVSCYKIPNKYGDILSEYFS